MYDGIDLNLVIRKKDVFYFFFMNLLFVECYLYFKEMIKFYLKIFKLIVFG